MADTPTAAPAQPSGDVKPFSKLFLEQVYPRARHFMITLNFLEPFYSPHHSHNHIPYTHTATSL